MKKPRVPKVKAKPVMTAEQLKFAKDHARATALIAANPDAMGNLARKIAVALEDEDPVIALVVVSRAFTCLVATNQYPAAECTAMIISDASNYQTALAKVKKEQEGKPL